MAKKNTTDKPDRVIEVRRVEKPITPKEEGKDKTGLEAAVKSRIQKYVSMGIPEVDIISMINNWNLNGTQGNAISYLKEIYSNISSEVETLRQKSGGNYYISCGSPWWLKRSNQSETPVKLANFTAKIIEDVYKDNGAEESRFLKISGRMEDAEGSEPLRTLEVSASEYKNLGWVITGWGIKPQLEVGQNIADHFRRVIAYRSADALRRQVFTHSGWRDYQDKKVYLIGTGAINSDNLEAEMDTQLSRYRLPKPSITDPNDMKNKKVQESFLMSLDFLNVGRLEALLPLWTSMYLAPLNPFEETSFTVWYQAPTGSFKSVMTALALCHYGDFDYKTLPAAWRDTKNQLEKLLFLCKDCPLIIDDWAPGEDTQAAREMQSKAEYIIRAQGNRQGKGRMRADTSSQIIYRPRGMLITSGEQLPSGQSRNARMLVVPLEKKDINIERLTEAQKTHFAYAQAMANYIFWISQNWEMVRQEFRDTFEQCRKLAYSDSKHLRLVDIVAIMTAGLSIAVKHGITTGAVSKDYGKKLVHDGWTIFNELSNAQDERVNAEKPVVRFIAALRSMLNAKTAVLFRKDEDARSSLPPGQRFIGWNDESNGLIYLDPEESYKAVYQHYQKMGEFYGITRIETQRDFDRAGLLEEKGKDGLLAVKWLSGMSNRVMVIKKTVIYPELETAPEPDK